MAEIISSEAVTVKTGSCRFYWFELYNSLELRLQEGEEKLNESLLKIGCGIELNVECAGQLNRG